MLVSEASFLASAINVVKIFFCRHACRHFGISRQKKCLDFFFEFYLFQKLFFQLKMCIKTHLWHPNKEQMLLTWVHTLAINICSKKYSCRLNCFCFDLHVSMSMLHCPNLGSDTIPKLVFEQNIF